jgi:hypothetical protein
VTANYRAAFQKAKSVTVRVLKGADHALSEQQCRTLTRRC